MSRAVSAFAGPTAPSTAEAVARAVRVNRTYEPNLELHGQYAEKAALFAEVYPTLTELNRKL
jgi:sugar (pentulose or hexulose) kinase